MPAYDYYEILGVEPSADLNSIRRAFRKKAMECHPDRGGTNAEMIRVNEAWEILSNPELRRRYDDARANIGNKEAQEAAAADAQRAHEVAEHYPKQWAEFDKWLNSIAGDFASAEYGASDFNLFGMRFPTTSKSVSGCIFISIGAIAALALLSILIVDDNFNRRTDLRKWTLHVFALFGGAWLGAWIHQLIGNAIKENLKRKENEIPKPFKQNKDESFANTANEKDTHQRILACEKCGQKLRIPTLYLFTAPRVISAWGVPGCRRL